MSSITFSMTKEEAFYHLYKNISRVHDNLLNSITLTNKYLQNSVMPQGSLHKMHANNKEIYKLATKIVLWGLNSSNLKHYDFTDAELNTLEAAIETIVLLHNDNGVLVNMVGKRNIDELVVRHTKNVELLSNVLEGFRELKNHHGQEG